MKELGFFMDNFENTIFYGEWKEQYDKHNRHEVHCYSFIDEVENTELFRSLNLEYDKEMGLYRKAISFALQGMITMQNRTSNGNSAFMMHVPQSLTVEQKQALKPLYPLLSSFDEATIVIPKSIYITENDKLNNVDTFYEINDIQKSSFKRRWRLNRIARKRSPSFKILLQQKGTIN